MKKYLFLIMSGLVILVWKVSAQQIPVSYLFVENPFFIYLAVAGTDNGFKVRMDNRFQWIGFDDAPITNQLSAYGPHKTRNIGYGGNISYDATGPTSTFKMNGAFATNFAINLDIRVSLALNLGLIQYRADGTQFEFFDLYEDPKAPNTVMSSFQPDAGAGLYVYHYDWYVGLSAQQLFNNNVKFVKGEDSKRNRLKTHFYGLAGYKFYSSDKHWVIEPTILLRKVVAVPVQMDLTGKVVFREQFWGGLNFRNTFESFNDVSVLLGYIHERRIHIGIAYDYSFAKIRSWTSGTVELVVGYNFDIHPSRIGRN
jgi:type IX secretion system PorP/SprF family membrane protein